MPKFEMSVADYKTLRGPDGFKRVETVVPFRELSLLQDHIEEFSAINPRRPSRKKGSSFSLRGTSATLGMLEDLENYPDRFLQNHNGIQLSVDKVELFEKSPKNKKVIFSFTDPELHGVPNGLHSVYLAIDLAQRDEISQSNLEEAHVRVCFIQGLRDVGLAAEMSRGLNTSFNVADHDHQNKKKTFDPIRKRLKGMRGANQIAYFTNDTDENGTQKKVLITQIIRIMELFDLRRYPCEGLKNHRAPTRVYSSSKYPNKDFVDDLTGEDTEARLFAESLIEHLPEFLELYDQVVLDLGSVQGFKGTLESKGASKVDKVPKNKQQNTKLFFHSSGAPEVEYHVPISWRFVVLSSLRAAAEIKDGKFKWRDGRDPRDVLRGTIKFLYESIREQRTLVPHPDKLGKHAAVYEACAFKVLMWLASN